MKIRHAVAALLFTTALAGTALAAEPTDADRATARALTLEGYEALDRKDYATAVDRFKRADALYHVPTVSLGVAHAEVGLGKLVSALATYSRIVREGVPPKAPPAFVKAVEDARRELEALASRVPNVVITVGGTPNVKVTVDGVEVPAVALGVRRPVDPGTHQVRASAPGFLASELSITILEGKTESVAFQLKPDPNAVVAPPPVAAPAPLPLAPVVAAPPHPPPPPPSTNGSAQRTAGFAVLGVGAAGVVVGAITGGLAVAKHSSLVSACPGGSCLASQQASLQSDVDAYHHLGLASTVSLIGGLALAGTGLAVALTAPKAEPARQGSIVPVIGLGRIGLEGSF